MVFTEVLESKTGVLGMTNDSITLSDKTIGRLSLYRRVLERTPKNNKPIGHIFSHELAALAGFSAVLVRRDLMTIGFSGNPKKGYDAAELLDCIGKFLDAPGGTNVALIGVGNLGRALLAYFTYRRPMLSIVAAFDANPEFTNRVIQGCRCYSPDDMERVVQEKNIRMGIIAVPSVGAQDAADRLMRLGVTGFLNFAPVALRVPSSVYVNQIDMTMELEKVAFYARQTKE
ncbi:TPA: redox-sensing transcriptional repressor Rex [Candidatus Sumerlaeota bacterium]|nr:redox-sensing transcriptional repressor Rex [Candidatus Sumerlaeota bacterium]